MKTSRLLTTTLALLGLFAAAVASSPAVHADDARVVCVYDPSGKNGDAFKTAERWATAAAGWGANVTLKPYTDEAVASKDLSNKQCDAALITGVRTQQFNRKSYTVEAMGLLPSYDLLGKAIGLLSQPRAAGVNKSGDYETAGIFPAGAVYLYVRDRSNTNVSALAGKKIATIGFDKAAVYMVERVGGTMIKADIGTFASLFNEGSVDACYAPATAYEPLELHQGIGSKGGIINYPVAQLTLQIVLRADRFPEGFGQKSREWASAQYPTSLGIVTRSEKAIPASDWVTISAADTKGYDDMLADVRHKLRDEGAYDPTVVELLERMRAQ